MKTTPHPPAPDRDLEALLSRIRSRVREKAHGSVLVHIEAEEGMMTHADLRETSQTFGDLVRDMTEMPREGR